MSDLKNIQSKHFRLFIDLDGVLADFNSGVMAAFGRLPDEIPPGVLWPRLAKTQGFYDKLPWTADGKSLWEFVKQFNPIILTGLPRGNWAEPQKRSWCQRELGDQVSVITCLSKEKHLRAREACQDDETPILVDDSLKLKDSWEEYGGIFILHNAAENSIAALRAMGFTA